MHGMVSISILEVVDNFVKIFKLSKEEVVKKIIDTKTHHEKTFSRKQQAKLSIKVNKNIFFFSLSLCLLLFF